MTMTIAEVLMEDQEVVLVEEISVVAPAVAVVRVVEVILQVDVAGTAQAGDHLPVQEADAVVLQMDAAVLRADAVVLHQEEAVLQATEGVAAKKVVLPQADEVCIDTIQKIELRLYFSYLMTF
jgi:phage tail protein X